jgi:hypothetical protein
MCRPTGFGRDPNGQGGGRNRILQTLWPNYFNKKILISQRYQLSRLTRCPYTSTKFSFVQLFPVLGLHTLALTTSVTVSSVTGLRWQTMLVDTSINFIKPCLCRLFKFYKEGCERFLTGWIHFVMSRTKRTLRQRHGIWTKLGSQAWPWKIDLPTRPPKGLSGSFVCARLTYNRYAEKLKTDSSNLKYYQEYVVWRAVLLTNRHRCHPVQLILLE